MLPRRSAAVLVLAACFAALPACGRKTFVKPPELVVPQRIDNLRATNFPDGIRLSWPRPNHYADGTRMYDLSGFRIERLAESGEFAPVGSVEVTDQDRLQQARRFRWIDTDVVVGQTYQYRVFSLTSDGYVSQPSNIATLERAIPTPAPKHTATPTKR